MSCYLTTSNIILCLCKCLSAIWEYLKWPETWSKMVEIPKLHKLHLFPPNKTPDSEWEEFTKWPFAIKCPLPPSNVENNKKIINAPLACLRCFTQIRVWKLRNFPQAARSREEGHFLGEKTPLLQDSCQDGQGELISGRLSCTWPPEGGSVYMKVYIYIYMKTTSYYNICDTYGVYIYIYLYIHNKHVFA